MNTDLPGRPRLAGKTALITGAARRVGAAITRSLHEQGANVVIHYRASAAAAKALAGQLEAARAGSTELVHADLLDAGALPGIIHAAIGRFGQLDLLINNASSFYPTPIGQVTLAQWDDLIGTNLRAPLLLTQAAASELRRSRGMVLNIVDIHGLRPLAGHAVYSVAKAGLIMLTRALARELAPYVRVNGIAPGPVLWPEQGLDETTKKQIIGNTLLHRMGEPADIARTVLFFAADAPYVTGQILAVDGGRSVGW
jgi:pteridine reductase